MGRHQAFRCVFAASALPFRPDFCFVDGEHTDVAALRDARFCLAAAPDDACIVFHDAAVIYRALDTFVRELEDSQRPFRAYNLPDSVFAIELGNFRLCEREPICSLLRNNSLSGRRRMLCGRERLPYGREKP